MVQTASLAWCMGVPDYLFLLPQAHHFEFQNVQEYGLMVRADAKKVELRQHRIKQLEAHRPGNLARIVRLD